MPTRLIDESIFSPGSAAGDPQLVGSRCADCGTTTFPQQASCPRCGARAMADTTLPTTGTIWSATVQHFQPKPPFRFDGEFEPFGLGYVDLGEVIVESRFTENAIERLAIGTPVELTLLPAYTDDEGVQVLTYGFTPSTSSEES